MPTGGDHGGGQARAVPGEWCAGVAGSGRRTSGAGGATEAEAGVAPRWSLKVGESVQTTESVTLVGRVDEG
jgi:hypothetical protein